MPIGKWLRTAKRNVRPFSDISEIMGACELRVEKNGTFSSNETFAIADMDPGNLGIAVRIPLPPDDIEERTELKREDLSVIVIVDDNRLKKSECVLKKSLDEIDGEPYEFSEVQMRSFFWKGNVSIDVAMVLSGNKELEPGRPFRAGHWIAKKRFSLNAAKENPTFPLLPLKGEEFRNRGLPEATVYFVDFLYDHLNIPQSELENALKIYVHEDVFNSLVRNENAPHVRLTERILMTEILSCIMAKSLNAVNGDDLLEDGALQSIVSKLEDATGVGFERLKELAGQPGYPELRAVVQSYLELKRSFDRGGM